VSRAFAGAVGPSGARSGEPLLQALAANGGLLDLAVEDGLALAWVATEQAAFDGAARTVCALAGRLYGAEALATALDLDGEPGPERVVAAGYERWGAEVLARLRGRFALVLWDRERRAGLAAVDALGAGGLFLHQTDGTLRLASELAMLLRTLPSRPGPDSPGVARWLARGMLHPGQTLYSGVRRLPGGSYVELEASGGRERRYWAPRFAPPRPLSHTEAVDAVRAGVESAVRRRLPAEQPVGLLLSGGLDSASVAGFASAAGGRMRAYSLFFPGRPSMDESAHVRTVTKDRGLPLTALNVSGGSMLAASLEYLRVWEEPSASPNLVLHRPLLDLVAADGVAVLLDGQGGDELFGCVPSLLADRLRRGRLTSALDLARSIPGVGPAPTRRLLWNVIRRHGLQEALPRHTRRLARALRRERQAGPPWLRPSAAAALVDDDLVAPGERADPRWWRRLAASLTTSREQAGVHDFLRRKNALAGLDGAHPFLDDLELVELVLALPPELSFDPELDRPLLRAASAGLVPDSVRLRRSKSYFDELFRETLAGTDRPALTRLMTAPDAEINAYVRPDVVRERLLAPSGGSAWALWRLATIECWLRFQTDPSFPEQLAAREGLASAEYTVELEG
jgi:asparagine synthase (glutamine-hydrolysing)